MRGLLQQWNPQESSPAIEQRKPYPASEEEAKKFRDALMQAIHGKMFDKLMQALQGAQSKPDMVIGKMAAKVVMIVLVNLKKKTGRKPHLQLALHGAKMVIQELANLARASGIANLDKRTLQAAAMIAGDAIEKAIKGYGQPQQKQPMPQQQPQQPAQPVGPQQQPMGMLGGM